MELSELGLGSAADAAWRVRIRDRRGGTAGAGVLLPEGLVLTCAHVVEAALGLGRSAEPVEGTVLVDFSAIHGVGRPAVPAGVADGGWFRSPPAEDLAVLRLGGAASAGAVAASLHYGEPVEGHPVLVYGHPARVPDGVWAGAGVMGAGGTHPGWWQLDGWGGAGVRIERGFSGAGVWDRRRRAVVGVVASVLESREPAERRVAWMIPLSVLNGTRFGTAGEGNPATGRQGRAHIHQPAPDLWPLVDALLAVGSIEADGGTGLLSLLPGAISSGTARHGRPRLQLYHLVKRCGEVRNGPADLLRTVREMEGDTLPVGHFREVAGMIWPDRLDDDD